MMPAMADSASPSSSTAEADPKEAGSEKVEDKDELVLEDKDEDVSLSGDPLDLANSYDGDGAEPTPEELAAQYDYDDEPGADDTESAPSVEGKSKKDDESAQVPEEGGEDGEADPPAEETPDPEPDAPFRLPLDANTFAGAASLGFSEPVVRRLHEADLLEDTLSEALQAANARTSASAEKTAEDEEVVLPEGLDPDLYDSDVVEAFKSQQRENQVLKREQQELRTSLALDKFDEKVTALGKTWQEVFGNGSRNSLSAPKQGTAQYGNRLSLLQAMDVIGDGYRSKGLLSQHSFEAIFEEALSMKFGDHRIKLATDKLQKSVEKREKQILSPSSKTKGVPQSGRKAAVAGVAQFFKDHKVFDEDLDEDEEF